MRAEDNTQCLCDNVLSIAKFSVYLNDASITTTEGQLKPS